MRVRLDKIASSTRNAKLHRDVVVGSPIPAVAGTIVAARVLDNKTTYNVLEDPHGRQVRVQKGDVIVGVLGARDALRGYAGEVPKSVEPGDILHLLNLGGVIGMCTSVNPDVGPPCRVEILGAVMTFPELGRRVGVPASINPGPVARRADLPAGLPPLILVAGSCMHAGKTAAACMIVRAATQRGMTVSAAKVTGVALRRDTLEMMDHGAVEAVTFVDTGMPSTAATSDEDVVEIALGCIAAVAKPGVDLIVVELGDGLLGRYGVDAILRSPVLRAQRGTLVFAANDPVAGWGGVKWLEAEGWRASVVTGPATDNDAGASRIVELCDVAALNARTRTEELADVVLAAMHGPITGFPSAGEADRAP